MSDEQKNAGETSSQFDDTIDDGEILTLSELLDQQREMDEVRFDWIFMKLSFI